MLKVIYDSNFNRILEIDTLDKPVDFFNKSKKYYDDFSFIFSKILKTVDYGINVFVAVDDEFYIQFLDSIFLKYYGLNDYKPIQGCAFSKSFSGFVSDFLYEKMKEVYKTDETQQYYFVSYGQNKVIISYYEVFIVKIQENVFILIKDITKSKIRSQKDRRLFLESNRAMIIIDDKKLVKVNDTFEKMFKVKREDILNLPLKELFSYAGNFYFETIEHFNANDFNQEYIVSNIHKIYDDLYARKYPFIEGGVKHTLHDGTILWYIVSASLINYFDDYAVKLDYVNITKRKEKEARLNEFKYYLDIIQKVSNIGIFYGFYKGNIKNSTWTPEMYDILELDHDLSFDEDHDLFGEHVLEEDLEYFNEERKKLNPNNTGNNINIRIKTAKGNIKHITTHYKRIYEENQIDYSYVVFCQDITEVTLDKLKLEETLDKELELSNDLKVAQKLSKLAVTHFKNGKYRWNEGIIPILDEEKENVDLSSNLLLDYLDEKSRKNISRDMKKWLKNKELRPTGVYSLISAKGILKHIYMEIIAEYTDEGDLDSFIAYFQDISDTFNRQYELQKSNKEKETLLQEIHHRVRNNLQLILSLIDLGKRFKSDNPRELLNQTQDRIKVMSLAHEHIFNSNKFYLIEFHHFIETFSDSLFEEANLRVNVNYDLDPVDIDLNIIIPLSLIIYEIITNTIKHAFKEKYSEDNQFKISLNRNEDCILLNFKDNGLGLINSNININNPSTLGFLIINLFISQIDGEITLLDGPGTNIELKVPLSSDNKQYANEFK